MTTSKAQGAKPSGRATKRPVAKPAATKAKASRAAPSAKKSPASKNPNARIPKTTRGKVMAEPGTPKYLDVTPTTKVAFLAALAVTGVVSAVCEELRLNASMMYAERNTDEEFAKGWDEAVKRSFTVFEDEARRRAFRGTLRPVFQQGMLVGHVREFSDTLAQTFLRAGAPEVYSERLKQQLEHAGGTTSTHVHAFANLSAEDLDKKLQETIAFIASVQGASGGKGTAVIGVQVDVQEALHPGDTDEGAGLDAAEVQKGS